MDSAVSQIEAIGGRVNQGAKSLSRPGSFEGQVPLIDWAVIQDPFGNEFCLVGGQSKDEIGAVVKSPSTE